jgi:hypothetical protein
VPPELDAIGLARTDHAAPEPDHLPTRINSLMVRRFDTFRLGVTAEL